MKTSLKYLILLVLSTALLFAPKNAQSEIIDSTLLEELHMIVGELVTLRANDLTRVALTDSNVASIRDAIDDEIVIIAREPGSTTLFIWDEGGKRPVHITISEQNLVSIEERIKKLFKAAGISSVRTEINLDESRVVLSGEVSKSKLELYEAIVDDFDDYVLNLASEEVIKDMIEIQTEVLELTQTMSKAIGFFWLGAGQNSGDTAGTAPLLIDYTERLPTFDGSVGDFFKIGKYARTTTLQSTLNAFLEEGKGRILSKPKLVVVSGEEASFLVGGEIPIRTTTTAGSNAVQENIEFKEYGIGMTLTPTVVGQNKIDLDLTVEISDIDRANIVGQDVAFTTRSTQTKLFLDNGETIIISGLIRKGEGETVTRTPFVSKVPILGALFRKRATPSPNEDTEVVISMTPTIIARNRNKPVTNKSQMEKDMKAQGLHADSMERSNNNKFSVAHYRGIPHEMTSYVQKLQSQISSSVVYPREAKEHGWEGTVKLGMLILQDGTLAYALVKESSGYDLFDEYAVATAKNTAPFERFPSTTDLQELNVTVPIVYSLRGK